MNNNITIDSEDEKDAAAKDLAAGAQMGQADAAQAADQKVGNTAEEKKAE